MTYAELLSVLKMISPEQLKQEVTVYDQGEQEFFKVYKALVNPHDDVLDAEHLFLTFNTDCPIN